MHILGISAYFHDSAACLVRDGEILAAAQEERFSRRKHDPDFPREAVRFCLERAGIGIERVDRVVFYEKPFVKFERLLESYLAFAPRGFRSWIAAMPVWSREKLFLKKLIRDELRELAGGDGGAELPPILFTEHHESHAASAFFPSPFNRAAVLCLDGVGEWATTSAWVGEGDTLTPLWEIPFPHSLGLLYSAFTYQTGFRVNSGEYKVMGLAPYGEPRYVSAIYENLLDLKEDGTFRLNMEFFEYCTGLHMTGPRFDELFGPPRAPETQITQREMDLARSVQVVTEEVMIRLARTVLRETGERVLCLAGGVALNCVGNGRILREVRPEGLWIQPAAGDAGGAIGAALAGWHGFRREDGGVPHPAPVAVPAVPPAGGLPGGGKFGGGTGAAPGPAPRSRDRMRGCALGPAYSNEEIATALAPYRARFTRLEDDALFPAVAEAIAGGQVVGWFQGPMEFGPRALGFRSILADPRSPAMQSTLNLRIKRRESFRPFAPSVLRESVSEYFELEEESPYMLLVAGVREGRRLSPPSGAEGEGLQRLHHPRSDIPAVTHIDYSARVQTVDREDNPRYFRLLEAFEALTGCAVLVNTSFNVRGEPIVCSPEDAYRCFMTTEMDLLVLENLVLRKEEQP